jgi:hypothetical protein
MVTTRRTACAAGVALLIASGCALPEYFTVAYWQRDSSGETTGIGVTRTGGSTSVTLQGNPDAVAQQFKNALGRLGMTWNISTDIDSIRIASTTRSGKSLTVVLKRSATTGPGEETQVQMEWSGGADAQVEGELLRLVASFRQR